MYFYTYEERCFVVDDTNNWWELHDDGTYKPVTPVNNFEIIDEKTMDAKFQKALLNLKQDFLSRN